MPNSVSTSFASLMAFLSDSMLAIFMAVFGGVIHQLNSPRDTFSWGWFLSGLLTAAFAGIVMSCALDGFIVHEKIKIAIVGMSGYSANDLLLGLRKRLIKEVVERGQSE